MKPTVALKICPADDCPNTAKMNGKYCHNHYYLKRRYGILERPALIEQEVLCTRCNLTYTADVSTGLYRKYCAPCRKEVKYRSKWDQTPQGREYKRQYHIELVKSRKKLVYDHYGRWCNCCGETNELFLSVDHVNNDGNTDEWRGRSAPTRYKKIIDQGFPALYQILCMNCNWGKRMNKGVCPHA